MRSPFKVFLIGIVVGLTGCQSNTSTSVTEMNKKIFVHGHRGSRGTHPENTIPAFQEAVDSGANVLEMDMHLTADDVVVVFHDPHLGKLCKDSRGRKLKTPVAIRKLTLKQLKGYDCGSIRNERFPEQKLIPKTRIPTLEEVLAWRSKAAPQMEMNIETKMDDENGPTPEHFVAKVLEQLNKFGAVDKTILQSFDFRTLTAAKKAEPKLRLSCLFDEKEKDICKRTAEVGAQFVSPHFSLVTVDEVKSCHAKSIQVVPWTLNEETQWKTAVAAGVDAIISDYPRKLVHFLTAPPSNPPPLKISTSK